MIQALWPRSRALLGLLFFVQLQAGLASEPRPVVLEKINLSMVYATQAAIGGIEVDIRAAKIKKMSTSELDTYQVEKAGRIIRYNNKNYLVDGHHMLNAMHRAGHKTFLVQVVENWSGISQTEFETRLLDRGYCLVLSEGAARYPELRGIISQKAIALPDDPYRSLAWGVKKVGGFAKSEQDYAEFKWARYLETKISVSLIHQDFKQAIRESLSFVHLPQASLLPGYKSKPDYSLEQVEKRLRKLDEE